MSDWTVYGRNDPSRWLNHSDGKSWVADDLTTLTLSDPDFGFSLSPTGPWQRGIPDEATLYAAALAVIPGATAVGDTPPHPAPSPPPDGPIY